MMPRILTVALLLLGLVSFSSPAEAFPWPSRWTNKGKTGSLDNATPPVTQPNPNAPPVVTWPPRGRDLLPEVTLPKLPSNPLHTPTLPTVGMPPRPTVPVATPATPTSGLASAVILGRPIAQSEPPSNQVVGTLPAVMPSPQVTTNPGPGPLLPPASPVPDTYIPPGAGAIRTDELVQQIRFDNPRTTVRGQVEEQDILPVQLSGGPPIPPPPPGSAGVTNPLPPLPEGRYNAGVETSQPLGKPSASPMSYLSPDAWGICASDHTFDEALISPVTSPFHFEDPRALTELRPLFIYGMIPGSSALDGGNFWYYGVQGRLAFGESFSLVINKLGGLSLDPTDPNPAGVSGGSGFAELNIGPKWTFWRSESWNMVAATGLNFQLPIGSGSVYQNTGMLGLDPYVSFGWSFGRSSYGSFAFMTTLGYDFSVDGTRSQYFHNHYHLSYDVANMHKVYPLIELNWYKYTHMGNDTLYNFEGKEIVNFGAANAGFHSYFSLAAGARFKLNENIQTGFACEWNLTNSANSLDEFRLTFDLIFRY